MDKKNRTDISQLVTVLNFFHPVSENVKAFLEEHLYSKKISKGVRLLKAGELCEHFYFVKKGAIRGYIVESKKNITTWITAENELVTSISSLDLEVPSFENIEAIEDCELLIWTDRDLQKLYLKFPEFNITGRKLLQQYYRDAEKRAYMVRLTNAEHKYNFFIEEYNHLANRIPLKYIASFLGITIETLSRVRKKLSSSSSR